MVSSVAVRRVERKSRKKPPKQKINRKFANKKPLPGETAEETIKQYHYFAIKTAKKYIDKHPGTKLEFDDAYALVCMALFKAHKKYDSEKGANFMTYASQWGRAYLNQHGDFKHRLIHVPPRELKKYITERFALMAYDGELSPLGLTDDSKKIYFEIIRDKTKLDELRARSREIDGMTYLAHLESPVDNNTDNNAVLGDMITYEDQLSSLEIAQAEQVRERLKICISKLNARESYIIRKRVMSDTPPSLQQMGDVWGVSRERARQIEARAMKKLRLIILNDPVLSKYGNLSDIKIPTEKKLAEPHEEPKEKLKSTSQKPLKKVA